MYLRCIAAGLLLCVSVLAASKEQRSEEQENARPVIELEGPSTTSAALYVQAVLEKAYDGIGYDVTYRNVPLARSFIEANKGELDGLRARVAAVADKYPNLIKVPFEILDFRLVLLADRRVCGACNLSDVTQVAVTRGIVALEEELSTALADKDVVEVTTAQQTLELMAAGKVQAAIMSDTNVPDEFYQLNHHWMIRTLAVLPDYHYLHKKHTELVPQLVRQLEAMRKSGVITRLREEYQLRPARQDIANVSLKQINIVSERWKNYTDSDQATYWRILKDIYQKETDELIFTNENWRNARQGLIEGKFDILVGAYAHELPNGFIKSDMHLDYDFPVFAFGADKDALIALLEGNQSFLVCFNTGYSFASWLPDAAIVEEANIKTCREKLKNDSVDMVLDYQINWPEELRGEFPGIELMEGRPLFMFFKDSSKGLKLKSIFEQRYLKLIQSGELPGYFPNPEFYHNANLTPLKG